MHKLPSGLEDVIQWTGEIDIPYKLDSDQLRDNLQKTSFQQNLFYNKVKDTTGTDIQDPFHSGKFYIEGIYNYKHSNQVGIRNNEKVNNQLNALRKANEDLYGIFGYIHRTATVQGRDGNPDKQYEAFIPILYVRGLNSSEYRTWILESIKVKINGKDSGDENIPPEITDQLSLF